MRSPFLVTKPGSAKSDLFPMPGSPQDLPVFKTLPLCQSEAVLARNDVGSIAFARDGRVQILPIHYVYLNGWIFGRTASPSQLPENASVALQVDEHTQRDEWQSVMVNGKLDLAQRSSQPPSRGIYRRAISELRRFVRGEPVESHPIPFHDLLFGIKATEISGKMSLPRERTELVSSAG